jgi:hypothetical protein
MSIPRTLARVVPLALVLLARVVHAQACHGTPSGRSAAYEYAKMTVGSSQGVAGTLAGSHAALGAGFATRSVDDMTGQQGSLRFSLRLPIGKLELCPGIGLIYQHDTWSPRTQVSVTAHNVSARAGAGLGFEQEITHGFSVTPFLVAQYEFALSIYQMDLSGSDSATTQLTGDTLSRAQLEYGLIARYRFLYGGVAAHRSSESKGSRPDMARWIIGIAFSPMLPRRSR